MSTKNYLERQICEVHEYVRHIFQLLIAWFTFFATVNYAAMGWLATSTETVGNPNTLRLMAILFITQNVLGIRACFFILSYIGKSEEKLDSLENFVITDEISDLGIVRGSNMPRTLYSRTIKLMIIALSIISVAWCVIPFVL